jgi:8-oxo-dGTP diphosphatase
MAELRAVYEAVWGVHLDGANFRRGVVTEDGWAIPTGRRARARRDRRSQPNERRKADS